LWQRILFIDYVQRSSSSLYRILRYRNRLNYITLHYITGDTIGFRQQLSTTSFEACELEIMVNYFSVFIWTENGSFMGNLTSWPMPYWFVLLIEHKVLHCYATNAVYRCLVAGQLYPSCGFSSADCRCFKVSNPCRAIHSTAFVHHTALIDRDF